MSKPVKMVARKNLLRGHEEESLRETPLKRELILIRVTADLRYVVEQEFIVI